MKDFLVGAILFSIIGGLMGAALFPMVKEVEVEAEVILARGGFAIPSFVIQEPSATYDCDDATLDMVKQCKVQDFDYIIVVGNLDIENERYLDCNHTWLWIKLNGDVYPYDWGRYVHDNQHYEGYEIDLETLKLAVDYDVYRYNR